MHVNLLNIEATLMRIEKLLAVKQPREPRTVKLTDAEWLAMLVDKYPTYDVPQMLRDAEVHYLSKGKVFTRTLGAAWLKRQQEWNKPASAPAKKPGLIL